MRLIMATNAGICKLHGASKLQEHGAGILTFDVSHPRHMVLVGVEHDAGAALRPLVFTPHVWRQFAEDALLAFELRCAGVADIGCVRHPLLAFGPPDRRQQYHTHARV